MTQVRVGFVGLGDIGGPMAQRLVDAGLPTTLWARRPATLDQYAPGTFHAAASRAELGARCDVVGVCVFGDDDVREVLLGADGVLAAMAPGAVVLIHSTVSPQVCAEAAAAGAERGVAVLDAPISGARAGAQQGTLTIMVGGDATAMERAMPALRAYGSVIRRMGGAGAGQTMKVLNNVLSASTGMLACLAVELGERLGLDHAAVLDVLRSGGAASASLESLATRLIPDPGSPGTPRRCS
ncbi:hypothetical protein BJF78_14315 [Pseudonocardia sp. CNS-139]|nr:hypothetical protein BJF78_14315 [Pseudonocardia sp. CNS-139]